MPATIVCDLMNSFIPATGKAFMEKLRLQISVLVLVLLYLPSSGQQNTDTKSYPLSVRSEDKDSLFIAALGLSSAFSNEPECLSYIYQLPGLLQAKGYINASVDSVQHDSLSARVVLYVGDRYQWASLD